ncbi:hypothetical protein [Methylobacterium pseudosasicola]|uniref:hypothetical protein n=1 Tax=Methylobacterium pseudosasicola TaxID=582667 RepID=UPI000AB5D646|nr:hypothetical protein [Methylobacterium pseudosasicola]
MGRRAEATVDRAGVAGRRGEGQARLRRLRNRLSRRFAQAGYYYGRKGQTDEKKQWHACQPDSIYEDDIEAVQR